MRTLEADHIHTEGQGPELVLGTRPRGQSMFLGFSSQALEEEMFSYWLERNI